MGSNPTPSAKDMKIKPIFLIIIIIIILVFAVGLIGGALLLYRFYISDPLSQAKIDTFTIKELPENEMPYNSDGPEIDLNQESLQKNINLENGYSYLSENGKPYNPVTSSRIILDLLDSYNEKRNPAYLDKAETYAQSLIKSSVEDRGALFFPYNFTYKIHFDQEEMPNPWYSGMAQGRALSIFSRLYKETGKKEYLEAAQKTFHSLELVRKKDSKIWVALIGKDSYYWIEEYPTEEVDYTLNGFLYAVFGLYDYYLIDKNPQSQNLLNAALTTAKAYIPKYRNENKASWYRLRFKNRNPTYHRTHIVQMRYLYAMTGDEFFKNMADMFEKDFK